MALRVIYRSYGGENMKDRPPYYSKLLCLASFLRAAEAVDAEVVFLNDGPVPDDRLRLMEAAGEVVQLPGVGMRGSYRAALELATSGRWGRDDVVWFSEDDYLYLPSAFEELLAATSSVPEADYFALYATIRTLPLVGDDGRPTPHRPAGWWDVPPWVVAGREWARIRSTTSTFGARVGALTQDRGVFELCMVPHRTRLRDHDTCLVIQGFEPYSYRKLARDAVGLATGSARQRAKSAAMVPFLVATNLRALRRPARRRLMLAAKPNLACHLEVARTAPGTDWAAAATEVSAWALGRGLVGPTAVTAPGSPPGDGRASAQLAPEGLTRAARRPRPTPASARRRRTAASGSPAWNG